MSSVWVVDNYEVLAERKLRENRRLILWIRFILPVKILAVEGGMEVRVADAAPYTPSFNVARSSWEGICISEILPIQH